MIHFFQEYLRINTAMPNPNYKAVIDLFVNQAHIDGFKTSVVNLPNDYQVLIITFTGSDSALPSIILNHHMDVVPAPDSANWISDPFMPIIRDGLIYARGTQDMKGVGVAHYFALRELKQQGFSPRRTIHMVLMPDEERGGFNGAAQFIKTQEFYNLNAQYVLDEGLSSGRSDLLQIKVSERKPIQLKITSTGDMFHGSRLGCLNAAHEMISFLHKIVLFQNEQNKKIAKEHPGLLLSINITSLNAGIFSDGEATLNVVNDTAVATLDMRVPPTMLLSDALAYLDALLQGHRGISYSIIHMVNERNFNQEYKNDLFLSLEKSIKLVGYMVEPMFFEGSSDLRFYLELGLQGFGLTPFTAENNLHGTNESISLTDLEKGKEVFVAFLKDFCL